MRAATSHGPTVAPPRSRLWHVTWRWLALTSVAAVSTGCASSSVSATDPGASSAGQRSAYGAVSWPRFGAAADPPRHGLVLEGHTNVLPDFVGPIDGSAKLTIFTEGNHFPVLLPLVFQRFPAWASTQGCAVSSEDILVITLPQVMVIEAMTSGSIRLGNAVLPLRPGGVYPQIVMGGPGAMRKLAQAGIVLPHSTVFAKHRGLGLLISRPKAAQIKSLDDLVASNARLILATPNEAGARRQYLRTLDALVGPTGRQSLLSREQPSFPGRLGIQHRDVPFALLEGYAEAGIIFGHLARFYADRFPDRLAYTPVDAAAPYGEVITVTRTTSAAEDPIADCFQRFLLEEAPRAYPEGGFASPEQFELGQKIDLVESGS